MGWSAKAEPIVAEPKFNTDLTSYLIDGHVEEPFAACAKTKDDMIYIKVQQHKHT